MCCSALSLSGIGRCVFGCRNERFGGCGTVLSLNDSNYTGSTRVAECNSNTGVQSIDCSAAGLNLHSFDCTEGVCGDEAIQLLKDFYLTGNPSAPEEKRARLLLPRSGAEESHSVVSSSAAKSTAVFSSSDSPDCEMSASPSATAATAAVSHKRRREISPIRSTDTSSAAMCDKPAISSLSPPASQDETKTITPLQYTQKFTLLLRRVKSTRQYNESLHAVEQCHSPLSPTDDNASSSDSLANESDDNSSEMFSIASSRGGGGSTAFGSRHATGPNGDDLLPLDEGSSERDQRCCVCRGGYSALFEPAHVIPLEYMNKFCNMWRDVDGQDWTADAAHFFFGVRTCNIEDAFRSERNGITLCLVCRSMYECNQFTIAADHKSLNWCWQSRVWRERTVALNPTSSSTSPSSDPHLLILQNQHLLMPTNPASREAWPRDAVFEWAAQVRGIRIPCHSGTSTELNNAELKAHWIALIRVHKAQMQQQQPQSVATVASDPIPQLQVEP